jgi:hypothetical protein
LYRVVEPGVGGRRQTGRPGRHRQRVRHQGAHGLGLLQEVPRYLGVDQDRCADQHHHHVGPQLVGGGVMVTLVRSLRHRLGDQTRRAHRLGHDDGRLRRDGAGPGAELPEPDHLVDHQQRDQQHEQPRYRAGGERVASPPPAHRGVSDLTDHQRAGEQRDDQRGQPALPT